MPAGPVAARRLRPARLRRRSSSSSSSSSRSPRASATRASPPATPRWSRTRPGDVGEVTEAEVDHAIEHAARRRRAKKAPETGRPKYDELKETTMQLHPRNDLDPGPGRRRRHRGDRAGSRQRTEETEERKLQIRSRIPEIPQDSHYTPADVNERVKIQILSTRLQEQLGEEAPKPSQSEIEDYYEEAKATQFTHEAEPRRPPDRQQRPEESAKKRKTRWSKTTRRRTGERSSKSTPKTRPRKKAAGCRKASRKASSKNRSNAAIFGTPEGQVEGPVKAPARLHRLRSRETRRRKASRS